MKHKSKHYYALKDLRRRECVFYGAYEYQCELSNKEVWDKSCPKNSLLLKNFQRMWSSLDCIVVDFKRLKINK